MHAPPVALPASNAEAEPLVEAPVPKVAEADEGEAPPGIFRAPGAESGWPSRLGKPVRPMASMDSAFGWATAFSMRT